jgi:hypothetical protein
MKPSSIHAAALRDAGIRPLAKSLHTVSVLVNIADYFIDDNRSKNGRMSYEDAITRACYILELDGMPDPHGLKAQALKQLNKRRINAADSVKV